MYMNIMKPTNTKYKPYKIITVSLRSCKRALKTLHLILVRLLMEFISTKTIGT